MSLKINNLIIRSAAQLNAITMTADWQYSQFVIGRVPASVPEKTIHKPDAR
jgi:hypothetical protein